MELKLVLQMALGRCLVTSVCRDNFKIICVVLGADTKKNRTQDSIKLIEYAYNNFKIIDCKEIIENDFQNWYNSYRNEINISKSSSILEARLEDTKTYLLPIPKNGETNLYCIITAKSSITPPLSKNSKIGTLQFYCQNDCLLTLNIKLQNSITKKSSVFYFIYFLRTLPTYLENIFKGGT